MRTWFFAVSTLAVVFAAQPAVAGKAGACGDLSARLPGVKQAVCEAAKLQQGAARSVKGRPILWGDVGPANAPTRVLVVGGIHGDELSSVAVALQWMALAQREGGPVHWRFVPALNPDGLFNRPARRVNANGVDLNRNFPTPRWEQDAPAYWQQRTRKDPRRWPGRAPLSEPESRFLDEQLQSFRPDLVVSIHAPYGLLDFDGPSPAPKRLGRLVLDPVGVFPGSLGNYGGVHKGMPVVTIELPNALRTPQDAELRQMWADLRHWMGDRLARRVAADGGGNAFAEPSAAALNLR
jgi:hypothetical protein